jgi:putative hydrolase of the HAD superfamily
MIVVFDLDDTLYSEIYYVYSGFRVVASFLANKINIDENDIFQALKWELSSNGRGKTFDNVLIKYGFYSKKIVQQCVSVYRKHYPDIKLSKEATECLGRLVNGYPLYLVTDGNKFVQKRKIESLWISDYFRKIFITRQYGLKYEKPSTYVFHKILNMEKAKPSDLIYIADNPQKDFLNLKKEGFRTVRVKTGNYKDMQVAKEYDAEVSVKNLSAIDEEFLEKFMGEI